MHHIQVIFHVLYFTVRAEISRYACLSLTLCNRQCKTSYVPLGGVAAPLQGCAAWCGVLQHHVTQVEHASEQGLAFRSLSCPLPYHRAEPARLAAHTGPSSKPAECPACPGNELQPTCPLLTQAASRTSSSAQAEPRTSSRSRVLTDLFEGLLGSLHPAGTHRAPVTCAREGLPAREQVEPAGPPDSSQASAHALTLASVRYAWLAASKSWAAEADTASAQQGICIRHARTDDKHAGPLTDGGPGQAGKDGHGVQPALRPHVPLDPALSPARQPSSCGAAA